MLMKSIELCARVFKREIEPTKESSPVVPVLAKNSVGHEHEGRSVQACGLKGHIAQKPFSRLSLLHSARVSEPSVSPANGPTYRPVKNDSAIKD